MCKCGAWLGELGQEPNCLMYIDHLAIVFGECKRVLKKTGTLFVNIDDSNVGTGGDYKGGSLGNIYQRLVPDTGRYEKKKGAMAVGLQPKSLMAIPALFQVMMIYRLGYICRSVPIWHKRSSQPSSAKDTFTCDYEPIYFFTKAKKYWFETQYERAKGDYKPKARVDVVLHEGSERSVPVNRAGDRDDGMRIMRAVMDVNTANGDDRGVEHYAAYPLALVERFIKAGCPEAVCIHCGSPIGNTDKLDPASGTVWECKCKDPQTRPGIVYDPFSGTGTTAMTAHRLNCNFVGSELQPEYHKGSSERVNAELSRGRLF